MEEYPVCGLRNIGNTCFMNSGLQALMGTDAWVTVLRCCEPSTSGGGGGGGVGLQRQMTSSPLLQSLRSLLGRMCFDDVTDPRDVLMAVTAVNSSFAGGQQHDAEEMLTCLLGILQDSTQQSQSLEEVLRSIAATRVGPLSERSVRLLQFLQRTHQSHAEAETTAARRKKGLEGVLSLINAAANTPEPQLRRSPLTDMFTATLLSEVRCDKCGTSSHSIERALTVSLELPSAAERRKIKSNAVALSRPLCSDSSQQGSLVSKGSDSSLFSGTMALAKTVVRMPFWLLWSSGSAAMWLTRSLVLILMTVLGIGESAEPLMLTDCFAAFCKKERLRGRNKYFCESCGSKQNAVKCFSFLDLPAVLVVHLKRFHFGLWGSKVVTPVSFSLGDAPGEASLELSEFCASLPSDILPPPVATSYTLYAIVVHAGSLGGGHYYAYVLKDDVWVQCSDERILRATREQVAAAEPYILFYRRKPVDNEVIDRCRQTARECLTALPPSSDVRYVARWWLQTLLWNDDPGVIFNDVCYCTPEARARAGHGHPPFNEFYVAVTATQWQLLVGAFGGGPEITKPLTSNS
eukprot:NODE_726_length_1948_cov_26.417062_g672_i0.p1 GENE.NODE_726_length_1948_cov_26.417062_g672_i0~~NODE_726_length_1948_cov_26.417062_g672_i0.p1  ORF type:complete len:576 (+),score=105.24 NODE_726_length_1948_cov_26.417062_g672_i0:157-1884(+)